MVKHIQLSKTCINCGLQKQLSAFLQITGPEGTSYGNICSTCRGSGLDKTVVIPESDEHHSSSSTGLKIDSKTKVQVDTEKQQQKKTKVEREIKEAKKTEKAKEDLLQRKEDTTTTEQKHRQDYIEPKKQDGFLNFQRTRPIEKTATPSDTDAAVRKTAMDQHGILDAFQKQDHTKQDEKSRSLDLQNIDADLSQSHLEKFRSPEFMKAAQAQGWIRLSGIHNTPGHKAKTAAAAKSEKPAAATADPLIEELKEILDPNSPGSSRRR